MTVYLSQILDKPVWDMTGQRLGRCKDVLALEREQGPPPIRAVVVRSDDGSDQLVPADQIASLSPVIMLRSATPPSYEAGGNELRLKGQVMDRQIVDVEGRRLVRVNDLQISRTGENGGYYLTGAYVGAASLMRRLGLEGLAQSVGKVLKREPSDRVIPWQYVAPVQTDAPIRLRITRQKVAQIDPADIAQIISELDRPSGLALLQTLDNETVADTMQEIDRELQATVLNSLPPERAADLLEEMDPDDAADLLGTMAETDRTSLLDLMDDEDSSDVEKLLAYPEDTAGGIMTTEFTTLPLGLTAGQALEYLRSSAAAREDETMYYVHVVDSEGKLHGTLTLRDLVMTSPEATVDDLLDRAPVTVDALTSQRDVARMVVRYDLLEVPVVDEEGRIHGIVTVDDAIDAAIPTAWKKRIPRFFPTTR